MIMNRDKHMRKVTTALTGVLIVAAAAGCSSSPKTPDEFRVVRKAPLTVPPEYNLRPPTPGEARPQELSPDAEAPVAVFGRDLGADASPGEKALVEAAGAEAVNRTVRSVVDFDSTQTLRKSRKMADSIANFGEVEGEEAANAEAAADITGGGQVLIGRKKSTKLPGL